MNDHYQNISKVMKYIDRFDKIKIVIGCAKADGKATEIFKHEEKRSLHKKISEMS